MARTQRQATRNARKRQGAQRSTAKPSSQAAEPLHAEPTGTDGDGTAITPETTSTRPAEPATARRNSSSSRKPRPYQAGKVAAVARIAPRTTVLSREQEYAFIREDLRRLVLTSGVLAIVMIALLFLIGP